MAELTSVHSENFVNAECQNLYQGLLFLDGLGWTDV